MTLLFLDGFDHYSLPQMSRKWTGITGTSFLSLVSGRYGGQGLNSVTNSSGANNGTVSVNIGSQTTLVCGFAFRIVAGGTNGAWGEPVFFYNGSTFCCYIRCQNDGSITVRNTASTVLGTSATGLLNPGRWYYLEFKATINGSTGSFDVHLNGSSIVSGSGVNTSDGSLASANIVKLGPLGWNNVSFDFDDLYILNTGGTQNNGLLGKCRVGTTFPNAPGASTNWAPVGAANNWACVNENPADDDSTYVYTTATNSVDLYVCGGSIGFPKIYGVAIDLEARIDDAGPHSAEDEARSGGNNYAGQRFNPTSSYLIYQHIWETDPNTSVPWTVAGVNAAQFGEQLVS